MSYDEVCQMFIKGYKNVLWNETGEPRVYIYYAEQGLYVISDFRQFEHFPIFAFVHARSRYEAIHNYLTGQF